MQLPEGVIVTQIDAPIEKNGVVEVRIEGAGWDTMEGSAVMYAEPATIEEHDCGLAGAETVINWNFPDE